MTADRAGISVEFTFLTRQSMRPLSLTLISLLTLSATGFSRPAAEPLAWMSGCWRMTRGATVIDEQWLRPLAGMMLGTGRTVRAGKVAEYEFVVLRVSPTGATYEAHPSGQDSTTFTSQGAPTGEEILFENPTHDFPQKVGYRKAGSDSMVAWIEGNTGQGNQKIEFPYARVACAAR